jgi:hypothetical protein
MVVLDNSGSMKRNDPDALMRPVVSSFVSRLSPEVRLGIVVFDQRVNLALELTGVGTPRFLDKVNVGLSRVDYSGALTDLPAAIERAIYELRLHGRPGAIPVIVFLTDGLVDVGDAAKDRERARWLREDLAQEAKARGIRAFGIAFTNEADFDLIQSVARTTGAEHYRVLNASDIAGTFAAITLRIHEIAKAPESAQPTSTPVTPSPMGGWGWPVALGVAVLGLGTAIAMRGRAHPLVRPQPATLYDLSGQTGAETHAIRKAITRIGRDPKVNDIVIPQETVTSQHAIIEFRDGGFYLRDLRSTNHTFRNGVDVSSREEMREVALKHRDLIRFDAYEFAFVLDALERAPETQLAGVIPAGGTRLRAKPGAFGEVAGGVDGPALDEGMEPADGEEHGTRVKPENCLNHTSWKATELCQDCGGAFCKSCMKEKDGRVVCVKCFEKQPYSQT